MLRKLLTSLTLAICFAQAHAAYIPIPLTGYNTDAICNGVGAPNTSTTNLGSTSASPSGFDAQGYWLSDSTFNPGSGTTTTPAMPTNLLLTSQLDPNVKWQLMPYTSNNVLRIVDVGNDSLVFQTPQSAGELYVLYNNVTTVTGGSVDITVNFTDGTTQVFSANATPNWFSNIAVSGITSTVYMIGGRYNGNSGGGFQNTGTGSPAGPQLYQFKLSLAAANYAKSVRSVKFSNLTTGNILNVFGITIGTVCSGTVTAGTVTSSAGNAVCPSVNFNLSLAGSTSGVGITYQWQSSTTGGAPWTNLGTAAIQTANQTVATTYRCYIRCNGGTADTSAPVTITMKLPNQCYCIPLAASNTYYLVNFTTTGATLNVNNSTGAGITSVGYSDYSGTQTVSAAPAATVNFSATGSSGHTFVWRIFVDWNQNGLFDAAEQMYTNGTSYVNNITGSFVVPATATPGLTRMRVFADYYSSTGAPCTFSTTGPYGEAEDYAFNVISSCSPVTGLSAGSITSTGATLSWTAVTGAVGYEYVLDNVATNPAAAGTAITAVTYNAGPLTPFTTYYMHVRTNCGTGFSSWVTIPFTTLCVNPAATITAAGPTTFCVPGSVVLNANTGTGLSYQWKNGTTNITGATAASYTATTSGSYTVVVNIGTCNTTSAAIAVTANPKPDTTVTMTPASGAICPGSSALLSGVMATGNTYQWYKDGSAIPGATTATYNATAAGSYRLFVANAASCSDTSQNHVVAIGTAPTATITPSGPLSFCQGDSALISGPAIVTGNTYQWQLNGSDISGATTDFMYAKTAGTYRLLLSNGTCTDTSVGVVVNVNTLPTIVVSPTTATTVCAGVAVPLTASGAVSYAWTPTTYLSATTGANVTSTPNATITYTVTGTDANGCVNTGNKLITVNPRPVLSFTPALATVCSGGSVVITANGASTYAWSPATGLNTTTGAIVTSTPTATITYTVTGTSAAGCVATATKQVVFTTTPNVVVSPTSATTVCAGVATTLTATGATTYSWSPATGLSATTGASVVATPLTTTTYTITGTTNGCPGTTTKLITVNPLPTAIATAGGTTNFCQGGSVVLSANTGTGLTYQWRLNTGNIPGATAATYTASASGTYDVVVSNGTCPATSNSIIVIVSTPPAPVVSVIGTPSVCQGGFITLSTGINAAYTYQWKRNTVNIAGANAASYNATTGGDYSVEVTNGTCVVTSAPVTILVNALPPAAILPAGPTTFCEGGALVMHASIDPAFSYEWRNGGIPIPGAVSATYIANATGNYSVKVSDATCSAISPEIDVRVIAVPLTPTITLTGGNVLSTGNYITYQWYRNGTAIPGATAQTHTALQDGNYTVMVTNFAGCEATAAAVTVSSVSVATVGKASVSIYPNPASDKVYIESAQAVHVSVRSVDGKEVMNKVNAKEINIQQFADGVYILRITNTSGQLLKTERLVKTAR